MAEDNPIVLSLLIPRSLFTIECQNRFTSIPVWICISLFSDSQPLGLSQYRRGT